MGTGSDGSDSEAGSFLHDKKIREKVRANTRAIFEVSVFIVLRFKKLNMESSGYH